MRLSGFRFQVCCNACYSAKLQKTRGFPGRLNIVTGDSLFPCIPSIKAARITRAIHNLHWLSWAQEIHRPYFERILFRRQVLHLLAILFPRHILDLLTMNRFGCLPTQVRIKWIDLFLFLFIYSFIFYSAFLFTIIYILSYLLLFFGIRIF